ncbi:MbtH family NRPS accessory protein [Streptomyces katrae]|uniref:MbtH family NRPS accessory protein n=1 Tax=Streptomyces katrae TaxID=68223 RepID=A0ABT7GUD7_9ACTN|nr:MbtH family NRPS accessory protein [Streptomyces katrae]MDK9497246.1 MbtH family NRPS accessory protein [Streptomyces katrae]
MSEQQNEAQSETRYRVVLNDEEQYSLWWSERELPAGWTAEGTEGTREECLARITEVWTDLRPASLRRRMSAASAA